MKTWCSLLGLLATGACLYPATEPRLLPLGDGGPDAGLDAGFGDDAGDAGAAQVSCTPSRLDFGTVAANLPTTLPLICTADAGWSVVSLAASSPVFTAQVDPSSPSVVGPGQPIQIDVTYTPTATESDTGTLTLVPSFASAPVVVASLYGSAIAEERCNYSITPTSLNFGQVCPDTGTLGAFTITNLGPNECLINGLVDSCVGGGLATSFRLSPPGGDGGYPTSLQIWVDPCPQPDAGHCTIQFSIDGMVQTLPVMANCCGSAPDGG